MSDAMPVHIDRSRDPVPALVGVHNAIHLAGRLGLLAVPTDAAWARVINALNEESEDGYTFALDSTATVPYDVPRAAVDFYTEELITEAPFTDDVPFESKTPTTDDRLVATAASAGVA